MTRVLKKLSQSDGYSYIEVFIVLLIFSLVGTLLLTNQGKLFTIANKSKVRLEEKSQILSLRTTLKDEVQKIAPPWFISSIPYEVGSTTIKIFYYNGVKEDYLLIDTNKGIRISNSSEELVYFPELEGTFSITTSSVNYSYKDYKLTFYFGVFPA